MAEKLLAGGWEKFGDTYRVFAVIPSMPDGGANIAVLNATLLALTRINPAAFTPPPAPPLHHATEAPMPPHDSTIGQAMAAAQFEAACSGPALNHAGGDIAE